MAALDPFLEASAMIDMALMALKLTNSRPIVKSGKTDGTVKLLIVEQAPERDASDLSASAALNFFVAHVEDTYHTKTTYGGVNRETN
jgi:hypothetical protein